MGNISSPYSSGVDSLALMPYSLEVNRQAPTMKFATINFCVSGNNMSRCYHTCSVHDAMGKAILRKIENEGHNFILNDKTELNVIFCGWTEEPVATMNHFGFLTRLLGIVL